MTFHEICVKQFIRGINHSSDSTNLATLLGSLSSQYLRFSQVISCDESSTDPSWILFAVSLPWLWGTFPGIQLNSLLSLHYAFISLNYSTDDHKVLVDFFKIVHEGNIVLIEKVMQYFLTLIISHTSVRSVGNLFQQRLKTRFIGLFLFDCGPLGGNTTFSRCWWQWCSV